MTTNHSEAGARRYVRGIIPDAANRPVGDFYRTPPVGTRSLLAVERFEGLTWEPACGDGAISEVLREAGVPVVSTDLYDRGYGETGIDFLTARPPDGVQNVVTNPPYTHAQEFAEHALAVASHKVALLCRLGWLEGQRRREFFETSHLWVFSYRLNVSRNGVDMGDGGRGGMVAFAWYVWEKVHVGPPNLGWLV